MGAHRIEIEIFAADVDEAHDFYLELRDAALLASDGHVVVTNVGMTTVVLAHHLHPA